MNLGLKNTTALITGGSKGIGRAIAGALAQEGVRVILTGRDEKALNKAVKEIRAKKGKALGIPSDATDSYSVRDAVKAAVQAFKGIDFLVNNVGGISKFGGFFELEEADWHEAFSRNLMSLVAHVKAATPHLKKSNQPRIINISSLTALEPGFYNPHYSAMKAGVLNLSKHLANVLAKDKILVNAVCAGPVYSDSWDKNVASFAAAHKMKLNAARQKFDQIESGKIPLGVIGRGNDVAGLVVYLLSQQAAWITGSCFHVDGGKLRSIS